MQLSNAPSKIVVAFAESGNRAVIPVTSSPTPGRASYNDGFPPLTMTPIAAGGIPPAGVDMNGVLHDSTAVVRWVNAGGLFKYDSTFADAISGYPKGALLVQSDGNGAWLNNSENNENDPDADGTGWVPGVRYGVATINLDNTDITLAPLQYAAPIIILSGTLTANVNLIFPSFACQWIVINNTAGAYTVTCKTAAGAGVISNGKRLLVSDGTNVLTAATEVVASSLDVCAEAGGTSDAITAAFPNLLPQSYLDGMPFYIRASAENTTATPTVTFNSGTLSPKTIVKGGNSPLFIGDIAGAGHWMMLQYDAALDKVVLQNPATWNIQNRSDISGIYKNLIIKAGTSFYGFTDTQFSVDCDACILENSSGVQKTVRNISLIKKGGYAFSAGANNGSLSSDSTWVLSPPNRWYYVFIINNPTTNDTDILTSYNTVPALPAGYDFYALVGAALASSISWSATYQTDNYVEHVGITGISLVASGVSGDPTVPTFTAVSIKQASNIGRACPMIAKMVNIGLNRGSGTGNQGSAGNYNNYGVTASYNAPPMVVSDNINSTNAILSLNSDNVYYASNSANIFLRVIGFFL